MRVVSILQGPKFKSDERDDFRKRPASPRANEIGLPLACVQKIVDRLGGREDFGALVLICEDRHARRASVGQRRVQ